MAMIKNIYFWLCYCFLFGIELYAERPASDQADEDKFGNKHDWCAEVNYDHTLIIVDTTEKFNENQYELLQNQILNNSSIAKLPHLRQNKYLRSHRKKYYSYTNETSFF